MEWIIIGGLVLFLLSSRNTAQSGTGIMFPGIPPVAVQAGQPQPEAGILTFPIRSNDNQIYTLSPYVNTGYLGIGTPLAMIRPFGEGNTGYTGTGTLPSTRASLVAFVSPNCSTSPYDTKMLCE